MSKLEEHRGFLLGIVDSQPDWTLVQYCEYLRSQLGVEASPSILCRFFQRERITLKKDLRSESVVTEKVQQQRLEFCGRKNSIPANKLIFIDETACWVEMQRSQGRSFSGKKAYGLRKFYKGKKMTLIEAMNIQKVVATQMIEKSMNGEDF